VEPYGAARGPAPSGRHACTETFAVCLQVWPPTAPSRRSMARAGADSGSCQASAKAVRHRDEPEARLEAHAAYLLATPTHAVDSECHSGGRRDLRDTPQVETRRRQGSTGYEDAPTSRPTKGAAGMRVLRPYEPGLTPFCAAPVSPRLRPSPPTSYWSVSESLADSAANFCLRQNNSTA
jgi:hypothetical protein